MPVHTREFDRPIRWLFRVPRRRWFGLGVRIDPAGRDVLRYADDPVSGNHRPAEDRGRNDEACQET